MKATLVTSLNVEWHFGRLPSPYIPLNLLCLAAALRDRGHEVEIFDQTLALIEGRAEDGPAFHRRVAELIGETEPDIVGLTTMCNSYPQTLTLARHCREVLPAAKMLLGGPQATAVDLATLRHFPWLDAIVRGEADDVFPDLVDRWAAGTEVGTDLRGVTWRDERGGCHHNESPPLLENLDDLPYPAYDLYPIESDQFPLVPVEAGRGCPFACTFCSTNLFFSRRYRIKAPERLVAELEHLHAAYGFKNFDLVHDMLTVNKKWVREFSRLLIARDHGFTWGCSARVDCVTPELLEEMAQAGCIGIFFGIETGSERLQPIVKKKLHMTDVLPTLKRCAELGMEPTASFITGFPDETPKDAADSLHMALDVLQLSAKTKAQMHMLAPLVGSPLYEQHKDSLEFDGHSSDISMYLLTGEEVELVRRYPEIFPNFYFIPTPHLDRAFTQAISASLYTCPPILIMLRSAGADLAQLLTGWVGWQASNVDPDRLGQDYYLCRFEIDFIRYLKEEIVPSIVGEAPHLESMVAYYEVLYGLDRGEIDEPLVFREFEFDIDRLNEMVRSNREGPEIEPQRMGMLFVNLGFNPLRGFMYLEVPVRSQSIQQHDELAIPDLHNQLLTQPKLLVHNKTQRRLLLMEHHMTPEILDNLRLHTGPADLAHPAGGLEAQA